MDADPAKVAWKASRTCPECEGAGLAVRYRQRSVGGPALLYCTCPYGIHLRAQGKAPEGTLDLWDYPWLMGESGARYRIPPRLLPTVRSDAAEEHLGPARQSEWWRTGRAEPNVPDSAVPAF